MLLLRGNGKGEMKKIKIIGIAILMLLLAGCSNIQGLISKINSQSSAKEKEIATLTADFNQKLKAKELELKTANDDFIRALRAQMSGAGNAFYGQEMLFRTILKPTRTDLLFHNYGDEGWTALGHLLPDYDTMMKINDRLKKELDETQTSLADLQKNHEAVLATNQKLVDNSKVLSDKVASLQADITNLKTDYNTQLISKQADLIALGKKNVALEKKIADDATSTHDIFVKFSTWLGIVSLACLAGAIWSPIWKDKFTYLSIICGGVAVGIWFITPLIVGIVASIGVAILVAWSVYKFHISDKTNNALINWVQEFKAKNPAIFNDQMKADLQAWMTKYTKDKAGNIITVPDQSVLKLVDEKLIATNQK
jgi:hypothetical protein